MIGPVVLLFSITSPDESPLNEDIYRDSYQLLADFALQENIDLRFVLGESNYKNNIFDSYWKFEGGVLTQYQDKFKANLVYLQTRGHGLTFDKRVNSSILEEICVDKYKTSQLFREFSKKTIEITKTSDITVLGTELIVLKPQFGSMGYRVQVLEKRNFKPENFLDEKFIAQEFIDSSSGIPGLINQRHELRLYIFNGQVKAAYLRLPAKDSYIANITQGAKEQQIDMEHIPSSVYDVVKSVDQEFLTITPRLYTIDVMYENSRPWIVELNDMPGMPDITVQPLTNTYLHSMLNMFKDGVIDSEPL